MRAFIVLALFAVARADVGGYNYGSPLGSFPSAGGSLGGFGGSLGSNGAAQLSAPIGGGSAGPVSSGGVGDFGSPLSAPADVGFAAPAAPAAPEYQKEFITYSAPESEFDDDHSVGDLSGSLKKNLRVVFIKGPENNGLSDAALQLAKHAGEERTAIYVLQKQNDISGLAQQLQNLNRQNTNKPEVHFVKYRTPEDAANAQHAIQQQYNDLGGDSVSHDGGVAPVLNYASQAPAAPAAPSNSYIPPAAPAPAPAPVAPVNTYIPPAAPAPAPVAPAPAPAPVAPVNTYIPPAAPAPAPAPVAPANTYIPPVSQPQAPSNSYLPIFKF